MNVNRERAITVIIVMCAQCSNTSANLDGVAANTTKTSSIETEPEDPCTPM